MLTAVTGAAGFVGGNLVRELLSAGHRVRACVYERTDAVDGLDVELVTADVLDPESLSRAFEGIEVVFHCAAAISIMGDQGGRVAAVNVDGTRNVVRACQEAGVRRLVHFSSVHSLNPEPSDEVIAPDRALALAPHFPAYTRSKAMGEQLVMEATGDGLEVVILNPSGIMGPVDFAPSLLGHTLIQLYERSLPALIDGAYDFVDVRDVVSSAVRAATDGKSGQRYILAGHYMTVVELAGAAERVTGKRAPSWVTPHWVARWTAPIFEVYAHVTGREPLYTRESVQVLADNARFDISSARADLGHEPRPMEETIRDAYDWMKSEGMLR